MNTLAPGKIAVIDPKDVGSVASTSQTTDQKVLKALIDRRHPEYTNYNAHWTFLKETYDGGREWFKANIFRYIKEGEGEYGDRIKRCYRFNHSREVVDLLNKYLFKQLIVRNDADAPQSVKAFWRRSTKTGLNVRDFSRQMSKKSSIFGRIAIVVDNNAKLDRVVSKADEKAQDVRTYAYVVEPGDLLDYSYDDDGNLNWVLIREIARDDSDPMASTGKVSSRFRLWTKQDWQLYEEIKGRNGKTTIKLIDSADHDLGEVPVVIHDNIVTDELYVAPALIDDIAYLDRAVANYLSNLDAIIQDQTFSQLAMPAQNVMPGEDNYTKLVEMGTKRTFLYDGEGGSAPFYLSPDPKQAQMILAVINKIINEIYHTVGLAGERTKQDNALGIDNSSGVAKAYDFERVNALLAAKADSLEVAENRIIRLVALWNGEEDQIRTDLVSYPDNFDTRGLYDEFDIAARLALVEAPDSVRQKQMETLIDKLFPQLASDLREKMLADLKQWPIDPVELAGDMAKATAKAAPDQEALSKTADRSQAKATMEAK
jgi:hypothetical protein